jgi:hypothetical protein
VSRSASRYEVAPEPTDPEERQEFEKTLLGTGASETVLQLLEHAGISQRELGERLDMSQARISKLLASENMTLRTLADLGWGLGVRFELRPVAIEREATFAGEDPPRPGWVEPPRKRRRRAHSGSR